MVLRLFSYVLVVDDGAAPNPFWGYCTLAICKPAIRRVAQAGDWIVGIGPARKPTHGKLIYAMRVQEQLPLERYFHDGRFQIKKPDASSADHRRHVGDNLYFRVDGQWKQLQGGTHTQHNVRKDLGGKNALVAERFYYFGRNAVEIPAELKAIAQGG